MSFSPFFVASCLPHFPLFSGSWCPSHYQLYLYKDNVRTIIVTEEELEYYEYSVHVQDQTVVLKQLINTAEGFNYNEPMERH